MTGINTAMLIARLKRANARWDAAMARPGYRDDPDEARDEGNPFTEDDWRLYWWADTWRLEVHQLENQLDATPEAATFRAIHGSFSVVDDPVYVEVEHRLDVVAKHVGATTALPRPKNHKTIRRPK